MVDLLQPGVGIVVDQGAGAANLTTQAFSIDNFIDHVVPTSIFKSLAEGEILQIVVFAIFAGVAIMALGERGKPLIELAESVSHMMLTITGLCDEARADRGLCGGGVGHHQIRPRRAAQFRQVPGRLLSHAAHSVVPAGGCRTDRHRSAHGRTGFSHARAVPARFLDRELRGVLSHDPGAVAALRRVAPHRQLCVAAGIFVQPRRHDGLYDLRLDVHRPGLRRRHAAEQTVDDGGGADADVQGRRRRAASFAGRHSGDPETVRHSRGGAAADPRHRPVPRHGEKRDERDRQFARGGGGGEIRGAISARLRTRRSRRRRSRHESRASRPRSAGDRAGPGGRPRRSGSDGAALAAKRSTALGRLPARCSRRRRQAC